MAAAAGRHRKGSCGMKHKNIQLNETAFFDFYPADSEEGTEGIPLVVILPGGGYLYKSQREGRPVASRVNEVGLHALVLSYTTVEQKPCVRLDELVDEVWDTLKWIHEHADRFRIDIDKISVLGFSAGGHLAAHCSNQLSEYISRVILAYPATRLPPLPEEAILEKYERTLEEHFSAESDRKAACRAILEIFRHDPTTKISSQTRPTFIFQTAEDQTVDPHATLKYCMTLMEKNVPCELHLYQKGRHGLSLADESCNPVQYRHQSTWFGLAMTWLKEEDKVD